MILKPDVTFSIVSHKQGHLIRGLLNDIRQGVDVSYELIITLNIPEDESFLVDFKDLNPIVLRNFHRKGFGENHNFAFKQASGNFFAVLNPDIRVNPLFLRPMIDVLADRNVGACGPLVYSTKGKREDSARRFPTLKILLLRKLGFLTDSDYTFDKRPINVDWVAGMFMLFRSEIFSQVKGFDTRYFMYLEDADICRRLKHLGFRIVFQPALSIVHDARRASQNNFQHFAWHIRSALRFLATSKHP
jgi:N-acetylglucosaminyl-diphospho-decaprenol L-rhamnosyltransferase